MDKLVRSIPSVSIVLCLLWGSARSTWAGNVVLNPSFEIARTGRGYGFRGVASIGFWR